MSAYDLQPRNAVTSSVSQLVPPADDAPASVKSVVVQIEDPVKPTLPPLIDTVTEGQNDALPAASAAPAGPEPAWYDLTEVYRDFSPAQKRNMFFLIAGIMCFKFVFETVGSSVSLFVQNRFEGNSENTKWAILSIMYGLMQGIGSTAVPSLLKVIPGITVNRLLAGLLWSYGSMILLWILLEAGYGGKVGADGDRSAWSSITPWLAYALYIPMGFCLGGMELIRRIIPPCIVGEDPLKLRRLDSTVHVLYEVAGTSGAFMSTPLIGAFGEVFGMFLVPPFFLIGGLLYWRMNLVADSSAQSNLINEEVGEMVHVERRFGGFLGWIVAGLESYVRTVWIGCKLIFSSRQTSWLLLGYTVPLVLHRVLENTLMPTFAKNILRKGSLSGMMVGGSNLGEGLGALAVLFLAHRISSPINWIRADAVTLNMMWLFVYVGSESSQWQTAGGLMAAFALVSAAWAAGDVSLSAYLQSTLKKYAHLSPGVPPLQPVMSFLYAAYIIISACVQYGMGQAFDTYKARNKTAERPAGDIRDAFFWIAGVLMSCLSVVIFLNTFLPGKVEVEEERPAGGDVQMVPVVVQQPVQQQHAPQHLHVNVNVAEDGSSAATAASDLASPISPAYHAMERN